MALTIELPGQIEQDLRKEVPDLDAQARAAFIIDQYSAGRLSTGDIAVILGFQTRHEAEQWLAGHGVRLNYTTSDLEADRATISRVLGNKK